MVEPSLSRIERERLAEAAKLMAAGTPVKWRAVGRRLSYTVNGKEHTIFTQGGDRIFALMCEAARVEMKSLVGSSPTSVPAQRDPEGDRDRGFDSPSAGNMKGGSDGNERNSAA